MTSIDIAEALLTVYSRVGIPAEVFLQKLRDKILVAAHPETKKQVRSFPILHLPDFSKLFVLKVDASDVGIGAVLMQSFDGEEFPIAYASRKLLPRERNYAVIEKECLAVVWGVKKFEFYLFGREFEVHTDHKPLIFLNEKKLVNKRVMRWALILQEFRFRLVSVKGKDNVGADFLSRSIQVT